MDWVNRINSVLEYIEENLENDIDGNKIASIYASPQGNFQRIFANITNLSLSEYIRKRRLTQAALDIRNTDIKIMDVAVKYGYNSAVAFSSAFKSFHGITPSSARKSGDQLQSFHRFTFTLILSGKGVDSMQFYSIENAEFMMSQMVNTDHKTHYLQNISEHNGVKCSCDGYRALVIMPESVDDWNLSDAYFDTGDTNNPKFELNQTFNFKNDDNVSIHLLKEQAAVLLVSFDAAKTDFKRKFISLTATGENSNSQDAIVSIDINTFGIITEASSSEKKMIFKIKYIEEALKFIMCSNAGSIDIYYNGNLKPLVIKSGRLYAMVMPVKLRG